jgi:hypothetical protein
MHRHTQGQDVVDVTTSLRRIFAFALVWGLGGNLVHASREAFNVFIREGIAAICTFPPNGLVYEYHLDTTSCPIELRSWNDDVPAFTYNKSTPFFSMLVPTMDTCRCAPIPIANDLIQQTMQLTTCSRSYEINPLALRDLSSRIPLAPCPKRIGRSLARAAWLGLSCLYMQHTNRRLPFPGCGSSHIALLAALWSACPCIRRYAHLMDVCLDVDRSVLFTGTTGVGKSVIANESLNRLSRTRGFLPHTINFSAQTSAKETQLIIESKLEKKRKTRFGAPPGKRLVFFIDDVNMPAREEYGAQPPIELLRQFQDFKGFYDRDKLFWKDVENVTLCAACAPPGGGRQEVTPRFFRHFTMLCLPPPSKEATTTILSSILRGFLADFPLEMRSICDPLVLASVEAYTRVSDELLPTPAKSHYTFNLRDLSKLFQGLLMIQPQHCKDRETLVRLWVHESLRVFHDRLINSDDKQYFQKMIVELIGQRLGLPTSFEELYVERCVLLKR